MWKLWLPLVWGFGVWLAGNLMYMRAMVQIHIFHKTPLNHAVFLVFALTPWAVVCHFETVLGAIIVGFFFLFYSLMLFAELWPLREDLTDVKHHAWGSIAGLVAVMVSLWAMEGGGVGRRIHWDGDWNEDDITTWGFATVSGYAHRKM